MNKEGDLRVWHIRNPPNKGVHISVHSIDEAIQALDQFVEADLKSGDLVTSNAQGLERFEDGEWCEYYDDEGRDIDEIRRGRAV